MSEYNPDKNICCGLSRRVTPFFQCSHYKEFKKKTATAKTQKEFEEYRDKSDNEIAKFFRTKQGVEKKP